MINPTRSGAPRVSLSHLRTIVDLHDEKQVLHRQSDDYDRTFLERSTALSISAATLQTEKEALRLAHTTLAALATKFDQMVGASKDEEALRALVSAGSGR